MSTPFFSTPDPNELWFPELATDEQRLSYASVRKFTEADMPPYEAALERHDYTAARALFRQCATLGVFAAELDEADGGLGLSVVDTTLLCEALGRGHSLNVGLMVHQGVGMLPVACFGTAQQRAAYLPEATAGERIMAFALTEPHCGSDALALTTSALPDGNAFLLNGAKQFITNAAYADCFITFARIPDTGITAFLVDAGTPGLTIGPEEKKLGQHASSTCSVYYDNVRVAAHNMLGSAGEGHRIALNMLNLGRLKLAAACIGKMKVLLPRAVAYTQQRTAFGQPICAFGMLRERVARMGALCFVAESMVYRIASLMENALAAARGNRRNLPPAERLAVLQEFAIECALVKAFVTESLGIFTDDMLQLFGGYGFSEEYPAAKAFRDARVTRLYEGTTEICRLTAVRRLCGQVMEADLSAIGTGTLAETTSAKAAFADTLKRHMSRYAGDLTQLFHEQARMTELGVAAEQVYALESARLRCLADPERDSWKTDVSAWYGRSLCTATLSAYCLSHRGVHGENDRANHSDTEALADAVVNDILKRGGVLPGGL